jgi:beta-galactosidase
MNAYVKNGGNLVMTYKSAFSDEHLKIRHDTQPYILHRAFGIHYDQFTYPKNVGISYGETNGKAQEWMEMVICDTAHPLVKYDHPAWNRYAAVAENTYGSGHTLYLATLFDEAVLSELLKKFFGDIGLFEPEKLRFDVSYPVSVKQGINEGGHHLVYFLNYSAAEQTVLNTNGDATELSGDAPVKDGETITLAPWGVAILEYM